MTQKRLWLINEWTTWTQNHVLQKLTLVDLFSKKQSLCTSLISQYLCKVLAEAAFKRSWYKVFKNRTLSIVLLYEYTPRDLNRKHDSQPCSNLKFMKGKAFHFWELQADDLILCPEYAQSFYDILIY